MSSNTEPPDSELPFCWTLRLGSHRPRRVVVELEGGGGALELFVVPGETASGNELTLRFELLEVVADADD